jgi:hypothetical protein
MTETPVDPAAAITREGAAAWRAAHRPRATSGDPLVIYSAPLMSRAQADDWAAISRATARAVAALRAQDDPNWRLILCSQDRPDGIAFDDRVRFVHLDRAIEGFDKKEKVARLCEVLPDIMAGRDGYMFALDADDVVHPTLTGWIRRDDNGRGYWLRDGYMIDAETGAVGRCGPRRPWGPFRRPFIAQCGSSMALYVDFRMDRGYRHTAHRVYVWGHRNFRRNAGRHGIDLARVPFPAALYVLNTGENMRQKRGKLDRKLIQLQRARVSARRAAAVRQEFGWDRL